ncbi:MAG: hydrogenase iron-sulfur subunit [candidate division Zixibacteria bacterium]|nr:hydrogenase iron-sulfur subunit [candidate division Zixibacteria bacterium]
MEKGGGAAREQLQPRILIFSTVFISDIGIDMAGSSHMHYPPSCIAIPLPCSSSIKPEWILYALQHGFDGVFVAADGTDCPFVPDCTDRTAKIVGDGQKMLKEHNIKADRVKMAAICSVCAEPFVKHMNNFLETLKKLEPVQGANRNGL